MIGIITAMDEEAAPLEAPFSETKRVEAFGLTFREGSLNGVPVVLVVSGIGTTNAAIATTLLIERYAPDTIIMCGVAGGIGHEVGDVIVARSCLYHDVDATAFGYDHGQVPREPARFIADERLVGILGSAGATSGVVASGNAFVADPQHVERIRTLGADVIDMESCAIAHVSSHARVSWIIIRGISDRADGEAKDSFEERLERSAQAAASVLLRAIPLIT